MHETGIVQALVRRLEGMAAAQGAERVSAVRVWLGALSGFSATHFREHFDEAVPGTLIDGAVLEITASDDPGHPDAQAVMLQGADLEVPEAAP